MKKIGYAVAALAIISLGIYLFTRKESALEQQDIFDSSTMNSTKNEIQSSSQRDGEVSQEEVAPQKAKTIPIGPGSWEGRNEFNVKDMEKLDQIFEEMEENWENKVRNLFVKSGLGENEIQEYYKMRTQYEKDRMKDYEEFHREMEKKFGHEYSYEPTDEMRNQDEKLKAEYYDQLRKQFGEEFFVRYVKELEEFNDQMRRSMDPDYGVLLIHF